MRRWPLGQHPSECQEPPPRTVPIRSSNVAPPEEGSEPWATAASLPATPADTFADGTWYVSASYFNGVIDSGFLPVGRNGETYLTLEISSGAAVADPPPGPQDWQIVQTAGGVVQVTGCLYATPDDAADEWAIAYTVDGSDPAEDTADATATLQSGGMAILAYDLPAQADGVTVKVRLQTRRNDGTAEVPVWIYSDGSTIKTVTVTIAALASPPAGATWPGFLPEGS